MILFVVNHQVYELYLRFSNQWWWRFKSHHISKDFNLQCMGYVALLSWVIVSCILPCTIILKRTKSYIIMLQMFISYQSIDVTINYTTFTPTDCTNIYKW